MNRQTETSDPVRYSVVELAALLGLSDESIYRGIRHNQIPHLRIGRRLVLPKAAIDDWLRSASAGGTGSPAHSPDRATSK